MWDFENIPWVLPLICQAFDILSETREISRTDDIHVNLHFTNEVDHCHYCLPTYNEIRSISYFDWRWRNMGIREIILRYRWGIAKDP